MENMYQKMKQYGKGLLAVGGLVALMGCDEQRAISVYETSDEGAQVRLIHEVEVGNDMCRLEVYDNDNRLRVYVRGKCNSFPPVRIQDNGESHVFNMKNYTNLDR